ncbi:MAG: DNA gyrase subunit A [Acutalibacteraceae bacterium]|nr:DNA gyrase subunit A [Acutalibacteraceae bacterium]
MNEFNLENQNIVDVEIVDEVRKSFLDYSMSVIVSRALPDVRDGFKPVHRRILYTMYENNLYPDSAYRKCADTVGAVLGRYHPHGDASVYDAMVRMAQDFSLRYPLVDGHGNFGSIDGYPAAAYRYTESRMGKLAMRMLDDIDKDTVDWTSNYDDRLKEPTVLPSRFPQLLVNGSQGIAVGMATNIPPHNLAEVVDAMCLLIDNPDAEAEQLMEFIKGPDFPTGGIVMGLRGIKDAYTTGRGKIVVRAKTEIEEKHNGAYRIVITEIPYMVNKKNLVKSIYDLAVEKRVEGISDVVDHSSKRDGGIRIVVDVKKDADPNIVLNKLFSYTALQTTFGVINLALVNGQPKVLTLKQMLQHYIDFQYEVIERRTRFDLNKAKEKAHILEGLKKALDYIDEVIAILKKSPSINDGKQALIDRFEFSEAQADAIVKMRLGQLTGLERSKIEDELNQLHLKIAELEDILSSKEKILDVVKTEALNIRDKFSDERRTEINPYSGDVDIEDLIPEENCVLTLTNMGYIKRLPVDTYRTQNRGGKGIKGMTTKEEDVAKYMFVCSSHDNVIFFSDKGKMYKLKAYQVPEGSRTSKGLNIVNVLPVDKDESITVMIPANDDAFGEDKYINMVTKQGVIKRSSMQNYTSTRKGGVKAIVLDEGDELRWAEITDGKDDLLIATRNGMAIRFAETDCRPLGRTARGVRAINLSADDEVIGMCKVSDDKKLMTISQTGFGRISSFDNYRTQNRGGKGITNYKTEKNGLVASVHAVDGSEDAIIITSTGIIIRIAVDSISQFARPAKGVRVMRVGEQESIISCEIAEHDEDEAQQAESADPNDKDNTVVDG